MFRQQSLSSYLSDLEVNELPGTTVSDSIINRPASDFRIHKSTWISSLSRGISRLAASVENARLP